MSILLRLGLVSLVLFGPQAVRADVTSDPSGRAVLVSRDASGRVQRRMLLNADGSRHTTTTLYWPQGERPRSIVDEDLDKAGRPTSRTVQDLDSRGRLRQRSVVSIGADGRERGTRTRYSYDPQGRSREATSRVER